MKSCTLVLEYNYSKPGAKDLGSVWIHPGDARTDLQGSTPLSERAGWTKIIGPVEYQIAAETHAKLKTFLISAGVLVLDEGIAD